MSKKSWHFPFKNYIAVAGLVLAVMWLYSSRTLSSVFEEATVRIFPSPERAYARGVAYLDPQQATDYDIEKAKYFFSLAYRSNPQFPNVRHQLARIQFLEGNFYEALKLVNQEIGVSGPTSPSSYYVKGLILGYMNRFEEAAISFEKYLETDPTNWAAINDYAWVLLRDNRARKAVDVSLRGLNFHPQNPWLLNTSAVALYEIGLHDVARQQVQKAARAIMSTSEQEWSHANPGNDPAVAREGLIAFQSSIVHNLQKMRLDSDLTRYTDE